VVGVTLNLEEKVKEALSSVLDPETGVSVTSMGLIREVKADAASGAVKIQMMLTSPTCPFAAQMFADVRRAAESVAGVKTVEIEQVAPEWWPEDLKKQFAGKKC
jgi:metal-sulfur cluster biosynthetic enzyme